MLALQKQMAGSILIDAFLVVLQRTLADKRNGQLISMIPLPGFHDWQQSLTRVTVRTDEQQQHRAREGAVGEEPPRREPQGLERSGGGQPAGGEHDLVSECVGVKKRCVPEKAFCG
jgi:hypothetical protein